MEQTTIQMADTHLQDVLTIIQWVVAVLTPIVTGLALAVWKLWTKSNENSDKHAESLEKLAIAHQDKMEECWKSTHDLAVEQGKVIERFLVKTEGH